LRRNELLTTTAVAKVNEYQIGDNRYIVSHEYGNENLEEIMLEYIEQKIKKVMSESRKSA
jgi:hypothetical protein